MTHSLEPSGYPVDRGPAAPLWHWRLLDASGAEVELTGSLTGNGPRFVSQGDAETWVGESWQELADSGVDAVVLLEGDREVYGPMSLRP
jgi:hypothetical protein